MRHPDCPRPPLRSRDALKRFAEHMRRQGVEQTVGRAQTLSRAAADAARAAFDVEAREPAGALAKLEIVRRVEQDPRVSRYLADRSPGIESVVADQIGRAHV